MISNSVVRLRYKVSNMATTLNICAFLLVFLLNFSQSKVLNLSCEQIKRFVEGHNNRRYEVASGDVPNQPAASEMKMMIWDKELAVKAAKWASNNKLETNPDRTIKSNRFTTGENLSKWVSSNMDYELDINKVLNSWFDEHKNYTYGPLKDSDSNTYTQMVWADSTYIGCGVSKDVKEDSVEFYVVCYYGPSGNYLNETPYKAGPPSYDLLCALEDCRHAYGDKC